MTALTGTGGPSLQMELSHSNTDHLLAPSERGTPNPFLAVGLALGAVGALLVATGGIGLPIALATVQARNLVTLEQRPAMDAALRLAPVLVAVGLLHLAAAVGLIAGTGWARRAGMALSGAVAISGIAGMVAAGSRLDPFAPVTTQNAATATADGLAILGFVVVAYAAAFVALLITRRT